MTTPQGEARSSVQPEQSAPKSESSLVEEKKVSQEDRLPKTRRKRYILDCEESPDGSFSCCRLIPLNEIKRQNFRLTQKP